MTLPYSNNHKKMEQTRHGTHKNIGKDESIFGASHVLSNWECITITVLLFQRLLGQRRRIAMLRSSGLGEGMESAAFLS